MLSQKYNNLIPLSNIYYDIKKNPYNVYHCDYKHYSIINNKIDAYYTFNTCTKINNSSNYKCNYIYEYKDDGRFITNNISTRNIKQKDINIKFKK